MARTLNEIVQEGQQKEAIAAALLQKKMDGTITADESGQLSMLQGNLLSLRNEAIAIMRERGMSIPGEVPTVATQAVDDSPERDEDGYDAEGYDEEGYDIDGYDRDGYDSDGYDIDGNHRDDDTEPDFANSRW